MKKWFQKQCCFWVLSLRFSLLTVNVEAKGDDTLKKGVYAEEISLAGMTEEEAAEAINAYVDSLKEAEITLLAAGDNEVTVTAGELGLSWKIPTLSKRQRSSACTAMWCSDTRS